MRRKSRAETSSSRPRQSDLRPICFAPAVRSNGVVLCAGQIGATDRGVPEYAQEEFRNAWTGVGRILEAAGLGFENILEYTSYHVNMHDYLGTFMKVRDEFVSEPWPAWAAIGITELAIRALEWRCG
jgi:enamine deaminase RidA (YjgF/YER057c/UK114 family)